MPKISDSRRARMTADFLAYSHVATVTKETGDYLGYRHDVSETGQIVVLAYYVDKDGTAKSVKVPGVPILKAALAGGNNPAPRDPDTIGADDDEDEKPAKGGKK